ncbi:MAG: YtxH domain-containing protein [Candidatus Promineifilaceae bacterium]|nr:YtxH domain-containing protein [Candidatus Promineifilaceae bacterium]
MKKVISFMAGALCGVLVGGVTTLLLTPASGEDLRQRAESHWQSALDEARQARDEKQRDLESQFNAFTRRQ